MSFSVRAILSIASTKEVTVKAISDSIFQITAHGIAVRVLKRNWTNLSINAPILIG